jgi:hypothetical protein
MSATGGEKHSKNISPNLLGDNRRVKNTFFRAFWSSIFHSIP